jgi:adenine-specific DNA-methyltransferase
MANSRSREFETIRKSLNGAVRASGSKTLLLEGDSLDLLRTIPDHVISLILTDPPYHTTKKENIHGDTSFEEDQHYIDWMVQYSEEWYRVLKPNGSLLCFCSSEMEAHLKVAFSKKFNILSQIVWTKPNDPGFDGWKQKMKKEALRQWYSHTERIIFGEPAYAGNLFRSYFGNIIREKRKQAGLSMNQVTEITGDFGKVNHGGAVSNWEAGRNVPSPEQYEKLCKALLQTGKVKTMPDYFDIIRPFKTSASKEFTDVWNFPSVRPYKGKHPAEKPLPLLEHAIEATTNPGDIVLDCFSGSGNTGLAALNLGRRAVLIEIDQKWVMHSAEKLSAGEKLKNRNDRATFEISAPLMHKIKLSQMPLFANAK